MHHRLLPLLLLSSSLSAVSHAQPFLVQDGRPKAEIIISESPTRMQRMAAHEFRQQIEKISGARLPILTQPTGSAIKVFIGTSPQSPVKAGGLKDGACRITTGPDWMVLIGDDTDFTPLQPFARNNGDIPRAQAEWAKIVGGPYGMPDAGLYKHRLKMPADTGKPDGAVTAPKETFEIWGLDEHGSFNAVSAFLAKLGARWYLPGDLGEVLPRLSTIELPHIDETVRPDFKLRQFNFRFGTLGADTALWAMRLGLRGDQRFQIAHGLATMTNNQAVFDAHPDWFAIYGGKPDFKAGDSKCQLCLSNEELFRETVRWARAVIDTYKVETVSIMPPDGYSAMCQCDKCKGKDSPDRNERGLLSDYVWDFVNRVAKEIAKTHPHAKVLNSAYGVYTLPPLKIDKLEPNVQVCIVGGRRPVNKAGAKGEGEAEPDVLRAAWVAKTSQPLLMFENYPFTERGWYLPSFAAHALGNSVNATKGISQGEDIWLSVGNDFTKSGLGFNHFLVYFTARAYWGGQGADSDAMLREYCRLFYGPAEQEMLAFFNWCEQHWAATENDQAQAAEALALFDKAKAKAGADGIFARRLALIDDYLKGLRMKSQQLAQKRGPVPVVRLVGGAENVMIDGKLDDGYWQKCPGAATGKLWELQTGIKPTFGASFKAGWQGDSLVFAIRCEEEPGTKPNITSTRNDDQAIWQGDVVELEIATETHSYYQIAISPAGHVVDLDRSAPADRRFGWSSQAEVATQVANDHWTAEIRLPVTRDENDPLHKIIGRHPTQSLPWHINICRQRIRGDDQELSALSPTGTAGFHEPMKFAYFYDGHSHQFEADPSVTDFIIGYRNALKDRKVAGFLTLADGKVTDHQKAAALEQAAFYERTDAASIIDRIPVEAVKKTAQMHHLISTGKSAEVVARFAAEDFTKWPFWKRGDAFRLRGQAYAALKQKARAETDLASALQWTADDRQRPRIQDLLTRVRGLP